MLKSIRCSLALVLASLAIACSAQTERSGGNLAPAPRYRELTESLSRVIRHEIGDKGIPAVSIALVHESETVWAQGFGWADEEAGVPAGADTVYRVGSVSKLFTDIGIMQLVERRSIDLDAPIDRYLPDFQPRNPFGTPITLRQLMSHRSGLVREPPVGNYFEVGEPSLQDTVASLNSTTLVYPPQARVKYSNAGVAVVGYTLEKTQRKPFADYLQEAVLDPIGMDDSAFKPRPALLARLAKARMWTPDGRTFSAPTFELGMAPAGSLYATVLDLGRFMGVLFDEGRTESGPLLGPVTLEAMWTPQFAPQGARTGYGIGFSIGELDGRRQIGHGGAVYGFATQLSMFPDHKLGVVVVSTLDVANGIMKRIADHALKGMLAVESGDPLPRLEPTQPVDQELLARIAGRYSDGERRMEIRSTGSEAFLLLDGGRSRLRQIGRKIIVDDRLGYGARLELGDGDTLRFGNGQFSRHQPAEPAPPPESWRDLIGAYGWDHNTLYILERQGRLEAQIEWFFYYPLEQEGPDRFSFPDSGLYPGEKILVQRDESGRISGLEAAGILFRSRPSASHGDVFRIEPLRPVAELRREAAAAQPPAQPESLRSPELVDLATLDSSIRFDIRYATTNNFMSSVFYDQPKAFLQRPAAEALLRAHRALQEKGYGLLIHDAYRPWYVTKMFWDATPETQKDFVADPAQGSRHNRGCAVDLTLYRLESGQVVEMPSLYDEFSERAAPAFPGGTSRQRWHRELLREAMEAQGFEVYEFEWWHFDYRDWREYPVLNLDFDGVGAAEGAGGVGGYD